MDTGVLVALIAAVASLLATFGKIFWDAREKKLERRLAEDTELRRYRTMLLNAADDLGNRIDNIRNRHFSYYFEFDDDRATLARRSTLFRFGQYFAWTEIYRDYLRVNPGRAFGQVSALLDQIGGAFASDRHADSELMLWREEQSAIADLMSRGEPVPDCIGFQSFVDDFDEHYAHWFRNFGNALSPESERLANVQALLAELVVQLDLEKARVQYRNGKLASPRWAEPSRFPEVKRKT
jgi:hypothetical protein